MFSTTWNLYSLIFIIQLVGEPCHLVKVIPSLMYIGITASHICNAPNTPTLRTVHVCSTNERRSLNVYFPTLLIKSDGIFLVQTSEGYNYVQVVAPFYSRCILAIWVNYNSGIWWDTTIMGCLYLGGVMWTAPHSAYNKKLW